MKVSRHNKQIGAIFYGNESDNSSDEDDTRLRLKASKNRVGRLFTRAKEVHDTLTRSLHDADTAIVTTGSALHALGVTKVSEMLPKNRRTELEKHMANEAKRKKDMHDVGQRILGFHRARLGDMADQNNLSGMMLEDDGSVEDEKENAEENKVADLPQQIKDLEYQNNGMKVLIEKMRNANAQAQLDLQAKNDDFDKLSREHSSLSQAYLTN